MRFQHDCEKCKPLGEFEGADLYYCEAQLIGGPTVIARHSSDGADYQSGMVFADKIPALGEARNRAIAAGYMTPNVEFSGTPAALSPEAPLERRVGGAVPPAPTFGEHEK